MNQITESAKNYSKMVVRRIEANELERRIFSAMRNLELGMNGKIVVMMSPDVHCILQHGIVLKAEKEGQKTISKIFGCDVKIVAGEGILFVGYDALGGEFDA